MRIDIARLGPDAQRQILQKVLVIKPQDSKYHNRKAVRLMPNGKLRRFDSQKEARRYDQLAARLRAGEIRDLRLQQTFTLQEAYVSSSGDAVRAITYKADFTYEERPAFWRGTRSSARMTNGTAWSRTSRAPARRPTRSRKSSWKSGDIMYGRFEWNLEIG